ncbi:conserved hypothetical protein [Gloeothece citriformis PCC 7424]|uniref:DUF4126 domain-containing protein n=1 Tax=Gloeothece citriformis (strain PCC 7424) TaxID=65393 RepID=B7KFZ7_GLOC7|nr:DUF4126 domain-containing protein [Gloeothece citriformis]ACK69190.1 conserved hypothetical protein [Gloeothece citriformis PCC 7424]
MNDFISLNTLVEILLGISLSAAAGFRVFVPLLILSAGAVIGHLDFPTDFDWVETPQALAVFAVACFLEITGYYIPWFDHVLDTVATPAAFITGTMVTAYVTPEMSPLVQWTLAIVAGGGTAGLTKGLMNILRVGSTATSGGLANPILATLELVGAIGLSVLAITIPIAAGILVIAIILYAFYKIWQYFSDREVSKLDQTPTP